MEHNNVVLKSRWVFGSLHFDCPYIFTTYNEQYTPLHEYNILLTF